jgi:hypothetical protein
MAVDIVLILDEFLWKNVLKTDPLRSEVVLGEAV